MLASSFSPKQDNNPSFRYLSYDVSSFHVLDYTDYYVDLSATSITSPPVWNKEYTFSSTYEIYGGVNTTSYGNLYNQLSKSGHSLFDIWFSNSVQQSDQVSQSNSKSDYLCAFINLDKDSLGNCMGKKISKPTHTD